MVKEQEQEQKIENSTNNSGKKSRSEIYKENYQKNKEKKKAQRRARYQEQRKYGQIETKKKAKKYYGAEAIKVLMSFKEYTELSREKMRLWLDFNWTLKDCQEAISKGFGNIVAIMKVGEVANNLVRDYEETAKKERAKSMSKN